MNLNYHHIAGLEPEFSSEDTRLAMRVLWPDKCFESGYVSTHPLYDKALATVRENLGRKPENPIHIPTYTFSAVTQRIGVAATLGVIDAVTDSPVKHLLALELLWQFRDELIGLAPGHTHQQAMTALSRSHAVLEALKANDATYVTANIKTLVRRWRETEAPSAPNAMTYSEHSLFRLVSGNPWPSPVSKTMFPPAQAVYAGLVLQLGSNGVSDVVAAAGALIDIHF